MTKTRMISITTGVFLAIIFAGIVVYVQKNAKPSQDGPQGLMAVTDDKFGGPFTMTDHTGKSVTEKDFTGTYRLMYFGFTFCPAICPTELSKITSTLKLLGDKAGLIHPIFVTVDPERDTPDKMKDYISLFHPSLTGLSGTPEQTKNMLKEYKIYAAKRDEPGMTEYTMDHSSFIYFMGPDDRLLHIFKMEDNAQLMADTISAWIAHSDTK